MELGDNNLFTSISDSHIQTFRGATRKYFESQSSTAGYILKKPLVDLLLKVSGFLYALMTSPDGNIPTKDPI